MVNSWETGTLVSCGGATVGVISSLPSARAFHAINVQKPAASRVVGRANFVMERDNKRQKSGKMPNKSLVMRDLTKLHLFEFRSKRLDAFLGFLKHDHPRSQAFRAVKISNIRSGNEVIAPDERFRFSIHRDGPKLLQLDGAIDAVVGVKLHVDGLDGISDRRLVDGTGAHGRGTLDVEDIAVNIRGHRLGRRGGRQCFDWGRIQKALVLAINLDVGMEQAFDLADRANVAAGDDIIIGAAMTAEAVIDATRSEEQ